MTMIEGESEKEVKQGKNNHLGDEIEIDLMDILRKIIAIRKTIYKAVGIGLVIGIIIALSIPKQYTVTVTLSPEMGNTKSGGLSGLAASFLGNEVAMGDGSDALNASLSPDIVSSTPFLLELSTMKISAPKDKNMTLNTYLDEESSPWWNYIIGFPGMVIGGIKSLLTEEDDKSESFNGANQGTIELSKKESKKIETLKKMITASVDKKTSITSITVTLQNPRVTAVVADSVVKKLQEYMDSHDDIILQSARAEQERLQNDMSLAYQVYSQVAGQLQVARAKVQEEKPVFAVVEPAVVPLKPSGTSKKVYVLIFICLSVGIAILGKLFGEDFLNKFREIRG